ncbi:MAG: hypothetical protein J2P23_13605 [Microlunatus sp.]|nr:hypothetical protein [Microlunatus sp.]
MNTTTRTATDRSPRRGARARTHAAGFAGMLAGIALAVTACAGSSTASGTSTSGANGSDTSQKASGPAYAACMRKHGVTDFPDPQGPNQNQFALSRKVLQNPHFASAQKACAALRPQQSNSSNSTAGSSQTQLLALAKCMRAHGVPNFPDPDPNGRLKVGSGLDPNSPTFKRALQTCQQQTGAGMGGPQNGGQ